MFKINYRITEYIDELRRISVGEFEKEFQGVEGFFEYQMGSHKGGIYVESPPPELPGCELVDLWLYTFLEARKELSGAGNYFAFKEIELDNTWLVLEKCAGNIHASIAHRKERPLGFSEITLTRKSDELIHDICDVAVLEAKQFFAEIERAYLAFREDLRILNPELLKTRMFHYMETAAGEINV